MPALAALRVVAIVLNDVPSLAVVLGASARPDRRVGSLTGPILITTGFRLPHDVRIFSASADPVPGRMLTERQLANAAEA